MVKIIKQLSPETTGTTTTTTADVKPKTKGYIPKDDSDFGNQALAVSTWWSTGTNGTTYPLVFKTPAQFATDVTSYRSTLGDRQITGSSRPLQTKALQDLDKNIEDALPQMRADIAAKFGAANRFAAFPQFGFIHKSNAWLFPDDRDDRKDSIALCINGIAANGMGAIQYGTAFWTQMQTDYIAALGATNTTDAAVSGKVASKTTLKATVKKTLKSIRLLIQANHPDDYVQQLRVAGFQREDI